VDTLNQILSNLSLRLRYTDNIADVSWNSPLAIQLRWYNDEQTILTVHYPEHWTWEEYVIGFEQAKVLIESVGHGVYVIQDSDNGFRQLPSGQALLPMQRVAKQRPKNMLKVFIVVHSELSRNFIDMMVKVLPQNRRVQPNVFVNSIEEALAQIAKTPSG
jgi:hypothetical protein